MTVWCDLGIQGTFVVFLGEIFRSQTVPDESVFVLSRVASGK